MMELNGKNKDKCSIIIKYIIKNKNIDLLAIVIKTFLQCQQIMLVDIIGITGFTSR